MFKAPVSYEQIDKEYAKDGDLDYEKLDLEALKIPSLTAKYAAALSHHRRVMLSLEEKYRDMREKRGAYYRGEYCQEDLEKEGWDQYQGNAIRSPSIMKETLDNDPVLVRILLKKELQTEIVKYLDIILKELNSRGYNIKAAIDFRKHLKGIDY